MCCGDGCYAEGQSCCGGSTCCDPSLCCDNGECCAQACEGCLDNGSLSGGTITVQPDVVCIGGTITFTVTGMVDSGGVKRVSCSAKQSIPPATPTYTWTLTLPPDYPPPLPPLTGSGAVPSVILKVAGTYSCTFTASADRECPPADLQIGPQTGKTVHVEVTPARVDATDPHAAKVWYHVDPHDVMLRSATFSAPGTTEAAGNLGTDFYFTFDQGNLPTGASQIELTATVSEPNCTVTAADVTATRKPTHAPPQDVEREECIFRVLLRVGETQVWAPVRITHAIFEGFSYICYTVPVTPGSKTLWVGTGLASVTTYEATGIPTDIAAWNKSHAYETTQGTSLWMPMTVDTGRRCPRRLNITAARL